MKGSSPSSLASQREGPPEKSAGSSSPPERIAPPDIDRPREAGTNVQARAKDGAEAKPEAKLEIKAEARPEAKLEIKAEARPEAKLEIKAEARPEAKLEIKAEARPEAKLEIKAEARPEAKLEIKAEARPEAKLEIKAEARPEAKLEIKGVSEAEGDKKVGSHQISPREKSDESPPVPPQSRIDAKSSVASTEQPAPTLSRLQAERALAKDDSVLVLRASQKPAVTDQTLFTSSKRKQPEESNVFGAASHRPKRSGALNRERVVWLKEKGLVAPGKGNFRQQVLTAEERVVHKALVTLVPHEAQLTGVRIATSSSKVHAQIETLDGETLDPRQIQKLRQDFERQTGRQLVLEKPQEAKANEMPGLGASPAPRPPAPAPNKSTTKPAVIQEPPPLDVRRTAARRDDGKEATPQPPSKPVSPAKFRHVSYAVAGAEAAGAAAAAAAHGAAVLALNPLVVVDPKIGTLAGLHQIENRWSAAPSTGGASRPRFYQPPQPETEDDIDPRSQQQSEENQKSTGATESKGKGRIHSQEPSDRLVHAQRLGLDETSDHENHDQSGGRGGKSSCRGCGTELPESQRDACPVCAQSGPDVIAMTSVNYRFAGSKFLAAADSVAASSQARGMLDQGMTESVVSLRYKPKIPGHKDLLRFRAT
jgi:hypothetical protein